MEWIPNIATRFADQKAKAKLIQERTSELRDLHGLIADYFDRLLIGPTQLQSTGILDYFDPRDYPSVETMFARYKAVSPFDIRSRNLTRIAQFATIANMEFQDDLLFDAPIRKCIFGVAKAAGILQSGHHLNQRRRAPFTKSPNYTNNPVALDSKRIAIERFALRWLDLSKQDQVQFLSEKDIQALLETYDSINEISHGELATLTNRGVLQNPGMLPDPTVESKPTTILKLTGPLLGRRQIGDDPNRSR